MLTANGVAAVESEAERMAALVDDVRAARLTRPQSEAR